MKRDWEVKPLGEVVRLKRGFDLPSEKRNPGPYPVVGAGGVSGFHNVGIVSGPGVTLGRAGASMGKATYTPTDFWPLNTSLFVEDFLGNHPRFVYYMMSCIDFSGYNSGSSHPMLNRNYVRSISVRLPARAEQVAVAELLGALDDKIAANARLIEAVYQLAQLEFGKATEHAPKVALIDVATVTMGSSPPGDTYNEEGSGLPFFQGIKDFGTRYPAPRVWCSAPVRVAEPGDVLISVRAPVGRINIADRRCCIGRGLASARSVTGSTSLLFFALTAATGAWLPFEAEGTVFGSISRAQLAAVKISWPETAEMSLRLENRIGALDARADAALRENSSLAELRDTLLPKLMSGELRVREAERVVSDAV